MWGAQEGPWRSLHRGAGSGRPAPQPGTRDWSYGRRLLHICYPLRPGEEQTVLHVIDVVKIESATQLEPNLLCSYPAFAPSVEAQAAKP